MNTEFPPLTVVDLHKHVAANTETYVNFPVASVNDHVVRISIMTGTFFWHLHPNSDESFLVIEGSIFVDFDEATIELFPGQIFTVPKNTRHRTRSNGNRSVNLTFERNNLETVRV